MSEFTKSTRESSRLFAGAGAASDAFGAALNEQKLLVPDDRQIDLRDARVCSFQASS
jgi:hypothetical protein